MKIKVKILEGGFMPTVSDNGDWIDLKAAESIKLECPKAEILKKQGENKYRKVIFSPQKIRLGVAMKLPKGFEAIIAPRSSSFKYWKFSQPNSVGVIDNTYCGPNDEWKMLALPFEDAEIIRGQRICQFRIQPSQKASVWQKLKWLFSSNIKFVECEDFDSPDRGGLGSSGK